MTHPATIDPGALTELLTRHPALGGLKRVLRNGLSINSATCLFEAGAGVFFAKRYDLEERDLAGIEGEHAIVRHLLATGFPTPALLADASGRTLLWHEDASYALYAAAEGEDRYGDAPVFQALTPAEAASAGRRLAELHLALADGPSLAERPLRGLSARYRVMAAASVEEGLAALAREAPALASWLSSPGPPSGGDRSRRERGGRRETLGDLLPWLEARRALLAPLLPAMPRGLIHGDWIKRNMFWHGDEVVSVIDFDLWNVAPLALDLALALLPAGFDWPEILAGTRGPNMPVLEALLAGYEARRPLTPAERRGLPGLLETARLEFYLSAALAALGRGAPEEADRFFDLLIATTRWFRAHPAAARSFFA